jgi:WD40 repeat protein
MKNSPRALLLFLLIGSLCLSGMAAPNGSELSSSRRRLKKKPVLPPTVCAAYLSALPESSLLDPSLSLAVREYFLLLFWGIRAGVFKGKSIEAYFHQPNGQQVSLGASVVPPYLDSLSEAHQRAKKSAHQELKALQQKISKGLPEKVTGPALIPSSPSLLLASRLPMAFGSVDSFSVSPEGDVLWVEEHFNSFQSITKGLHRFVRKDGKWEWEQTITPGFWKRGSQEMGALLSQNVSEQFWLLPGGKAYLAQKSRSGVVNQGDLTWEMEWRSLESPAREPHLFKVPKGANYVGSIEYIAASPDGQYLVLRYAYDPSGRDYQRLKSKGMDYHYVIWDTVTQSMKEEVFLGLPDGGVSLWDVHFMLSNSIALRSNFIFHSSFTHFWNSGQRSVVDKTFRSSDASYITLFNQTQDTPPQYLLSPTFVMEVSVSSDGELIAWGDKHNRIRVFRSADRSMAPLVDTDWGTGPFKMQWATDRNTLYTLGNDGVLREFSFD